MVIALVIVSCVDNLKLIFESSCRGDHHAFNTGVAGDHGDGGHGGHGDGGGNVDNDNSMYMKPET